MRYALLINKDERAWNALTDAERDAWRARYMEYGKKMMQAGIIRSGAILEHTESATTVRVREGKRMLTDGPFAETAEQVAGIAIIDVATLDEALAWAAGHPDAEWGSVEVRPLLPGSP